MLNFHAMQKLVNGQKGNAGTNEITIGCYVKQHWLSVHVWLQMWGPIQFGEKVNLL